MSKKDQAIEFRRLAALQPKDSDIEVALTNAAMQWEIDAKRYEESKQLQNIGRSCFESIADMVAALECDYDRLEELRDARDGYEPTEVSARDRCDPAYQMPGSWAQENEEDAEELAELEKAAGDCELREDAEQRIQEDPLSIELAGTWSIGDTPTADKAIILLGTGGPATRIVCELSDGEPSRAWIESQDWFKPWTEFVGGDSETLLTYCRCFYFGEG
jgi:hypothetical protein